MSYTSFITDTDIGIPTGIAFDTSGNVYVADSSNNVVNRYPYTGGSTPDISLNVTDPAGLAFDTSGNLYVCEGGLNGRIIKFTNTITNNSGTVFSEGTDSDPNYHHFKTSAQLTGIATYGDYVFAADYANNIIYTLDRYTTGGNPPAAGNVLYWNIDVSMQKPYQLTQSTVGGKNYLYYANSSSGTVYNAQINPSGGGYLLGGTFADLYDVSLSSPYGVVNNVNDTSGNPFFSDTSSNTIIEAGVGTKIFYSSNVTPTYLAIDSSNYLYFSSPGDSTIYKTTEALCFNEGTKILCLNHSFEEEYVPIQDLKKGDLVKTYLHGYRKVDITHKGVLFNNPNKWNQCMYKMEKTEENGILEDLIVTGGHSILVDSISEEEQERLDKLGLSDFPVQYKFDDKYLLLVSVSDHFVALTDNKIYTYYHLTLENNGDGNQQFGIWANGVLTETPCKNYLLTHT